MQVKLLKSKIHRARVTDTKIDYPGSLGVDEELMEEVGLKPYESIIVANVTNGERLETYVVPEERGSKKIVILGAAARLCNVSDVVILFSFGFYNEEESKVHKPSVIALNENNDIIKRIS